MVLNSRNSKFPSGNMNKAAWSRGDPAGLILPLTPVVPVCVAVTATPSDGETGRTHEDTFGVSLLL